MSHGTQLQLKPARLVSEKVASRCVSAMKNALGIRPFITCPAAWLYKGFEDPVFTGHLNLFFGYHRYLQRHREIGGHTDRHFIVTGGFNRLVQLNLSAIHRESLCL